MRTRLWFTGTVMLALGSIGCGSDAPDAKEVADTTAGRTAEMLRAASTGTRMMGELSSIESLGAAATILQKSFGAVPITGGSPLCGEQEDCFSQIPDNPIPTDPTVADAQAALLEKYLRERIFTQDNVEEKKGDSLIFRLTGEDVCTTGTAAPDPGCVAAVNTVELRIRATRADDDGMDLGFLIGSGRAEPLVLRFTKRSMAVVVDLAGTKSAVQQLSAEAAQELPRVMVGKVELRLTKNGEQSVSLSTGVLEALRLEVEDEGVTHTFTTAKANPLSTLTVDVRAQRVSFELNLGPTEYRRPYGGTSPLSGQELVLSLSGLSFEFDAEEGKDDFVIAHVGLGQAQSSISVGGTKIFTVDLNPSSNRHFDLRLKKGADGLPLVRVQPEFDLETRFFLQPLKADPEVDVPSFYENQTYRTRLSGGGAPSFRPVDENAAAGFPGGLQVVSGELTMELDGVRRVTVPTGKCLVGKDTATPGTHPLLGYFETRDCP